MVRKVNGLPRIVIITGPTATGKSRAALDAAHALAGRGLNSSIVSADSMQVYRYMDVGTDKLRPEQREGIEHHLVDVVLPDQTFSAARFARESGRIIADEWEQGRRTVVAGGTGFYLRALLNGLFPGPGAHPGIRARLAEEAGELGIESLHRRLAEVDPDSARRIHPRDRTRIVRALEVFEVTGEPLSTHFSRQSGQGPGCEALIIALALDRARMYERINQRVVEMIGLGLADEVRRLREMGYGSELASQQALGYKEMHLMLDQKIAPERALYLIQRNTRHYARRQLTWFRKEPNLVWMDAQAQDRIAERAVRFMEEGS